MSISKKVLPVIIISQFFCTSLWFAGNGVMDNLVSDFQLNENALGHLTSSVQFGFIFGTLLFAFFTIVDRFSPSKVFLASAFLGALVNLGVIWEGNTLSTLLIFRFLTGFFLAGIYPVGMKIAADYYDKGLGKSLGFLVGALVLGTALPHLLKDVTSEIPWKYVSISTSILAITGGVIVYLFVPNGPYRKPSQKFDIKVFSKVFQNRSLRSAAFGYFGHMWELYAFWTFTPIILSSYFNFHHQEDFNISLLSFLIIAVGFISCSFGGILSQKIGEKKVATISLLLSGVCCLALPFVFTVNSNLFFIVFLLFWGMMVIADSPMFSTLVAKNANPEIKGTALTLVNSIGFAITIVSIQLLTLLLAYNSIYIYMILAMGPILGLLALRNM
ncbi:MFS transporter [Pseudotenacibaculum haliotis]|uniref:Nitrate/nitrite transporter n=1 Tax=Pseudotenacibaculum haliotis TaxID=1862138 RepID=A0ABW5LQ32_9FLAO